MYFLTGITGNVGGAAARKLLAGGHQVRALVRDAVKAAAWREKGVDLRQGDVKDAPALASAMEGADGAFVMMPPDAAPENDFAEARGIAAAYRDAIGRAKPKRVVMLSSIGSEKPKGLGPITATHILETALAELAMPTAFVRAGSFLENYVFSCKRAGETGIFDTFFTPTDRPVPVIATEDIGNEVASLLASTWSGRRIVELGTPVTPDDLAKAMAKAATARSIPRDQWAAVIGHMGMSESRALAFAEMEDSFNGGWIAFGVPGTEPRAATITPSQFFDRLK